MTGRSIVLARGLRSEVNAVYSSLVSVQELKDQIAALPPEAQNELMAFLFHVRHREDSEYTRTLTRRANDRDPAHWLSPEEFEKRLDQKTG